MNIEELRLKLDSLVTEINSLSQRDIVYFHQQNIVKENMAIKGEKGTHVYKTSLYIHPNKSFTYIDISLYGISLEKEMFDFMVNLCGSKPYGYAHPQDRQPYWKVRIENFHIIRKAAYRYAGLDHRSVAMFQGDISKKTLDSILMNPLTLKAQCEQINWPLHTMYALKMSPGKWKEGQDSGLRPEQVVVTRLAAENRESCWCEGMGINILMRAAALDVLTKRSIFYGTNHSPREDAIRGGFRLETVKAFKSEILTCINNIGHKQLQENIAEICADTGIQYYFTKTYPCQGILLNFLSSLADSVDSDFIAKIAALFMTNPYDYRLGWPDLTVIDKNGVSFIEVKANDSLHESQLRFAKEIAKPLGLVCCVVQLCPENN